jgi:hypothetical protein
VREWGGDAAGVRSGLRELENKATGGDNEQGGAKDGEGPEPGASRASNRKLKGGGLDKAKVKGPTINDKDAEADDGAMDSPSFYKAVEDAYTYANRTLLRVLMEDQMLIPRLR